MNTADRFIPPDFTTPFFESAPNAKIGVVEADGVAPAEYHALSIYPEYFKIDGRWVLASESRMDAVPVVCDDGVRIVEFRNLKKGDRVVVGRKTHRRASIYTRTGFAPRSPSLIGSVSAAVAAAKRPFQRTMTSYTI